MAQNRVAAPQGGKRAYMDYQAQPYSEIKLDCTEERGGDSRYCRIKERIYMKGETNYFEKNNKNTLRFMFRHK
jgi:hypothetical protein